MTEEEKSKCKGYRRCTEKGVCGHEKGACGDCCAPEEPNLDQEEEEE